MRVARVLTLGLLFGLGCSGEAPERKLETHILCVWEGATLQTPPAGLERLKPTPHLDTWLEEGRLILAGPGDSPSTSASLASLLTGQTVEQHGLRSVRELGAQAIRAAVSTRAERQSPECRSLGSVSEAHFAVQGLSRGLQTWHAPVFSEDSETWSAQQVWGAVQEDLRVALQRDSTVFLVLHFGDLRGDAVRTADPSREQLELGLAAWRGKGGVIDQAFDGGDPEVPLLRRLSNVLLRRKNDPRREAFVLTLRASVLTQLDGVLGELRLLLKESGRLAGARVELSSGRDKDLSLPEGQGVLVEGSGEFAGLQAKLIEPGKAMDLELNSEFELPTRGLEFQVRLEHPRMFALPAEGLWLGSSTLEESNVTCLLAQRSDPWPENALVGPTLDVQNAGGRRFAGTVSGSPGASVELLIETFPPQIGWPGDVQVKGGAIEPLAQRPGAFWIRGEAPLTFTLPPRSPSARLGVLLRLDGKRVSGSRMRYLKRVFRGATSLDLGFSAGSWLEPLLREGSQAAGESWIRIQLVDKLPLPETIALLSADELAIFQRLDEDE